jgi:hypothetical protein
MRACGSKSGSKTRPQNRQKLENLLEKSGFSSPEIQFSLLVIRFFLLAFRFSSTAFQFFSMAFQLSSTAFCFPQRLSTFRNAFLLSAMPFCFPQRLSDFPQRLSNFPQWLSNFPQRLSAFQEIRENLSTVASIQKIAIRASYSLRKNIQTLNILSFTNRHSPYSLASV